MGVQPATTAAMLVTFALVAGAGIDRFAQAQGMAPGGMREHMREMMRGAVPPPGLTPEALPAPESEGAKLVARFCVQCHDLPSPRYKTSAQWPPVFARMFMRMRAMAQGGMMGPVSVPTQAEAHALLNYLQRHAMIEARPAELERGSPADRVVFGIACAVCHALPSPSLHTADEWPGVVARMQANMQLMNKPQLTDAERDAIVAFLRDASKSGT